jgi:hypothetical protein
MRKIGATVLLYATSCLIVFAQASGTAPANAYSDSYAVHSSAVADRRELREVQRPFL